MIEIDDTDIGRSVVYAPREGVRTEVGIITGFNDNVVFVRYDDDIGSKATRRADLFWHQEPYFLARFGF